MKETKFKQTELGPIPTDWEIVPLNSVMNTFTGLTYSPDDVKDYGILVLRSSNIQNGQLDLQRDDNVFVNCPIPERAVASDGDILVCVRNGSTRLIGKSALIPPLTRPCAFGAFMTVIRPTNSNNVRYFLYVWQSEIIQKQVKENLGATINQITGADIKRYIIPLPPSEEQEKIASALTSIDNLLASLEKLIDKKKAIKQGAMQELLSGQTRLPGFNKQWRTIYVDESFYLLGNNTLSRDNLSMEGGVLNVHYGDILTKYDNCIDVKKAGLPFISREIRTKALCPIQNGDVIIADTAEDETVGKACEMLGITSEQVEAGLHTVVMRPRIPFASKFLGYYINSNHFHDQILPFIQGTKVASISRSALKGLTIKYPSLEEQRAIASLLSSMDAQIISLEHKRKKYESIKQGMMQQLLTGKIRLV